MAEGAAIILGPDDGRNEQISEVRFRRTEHRHRPA
jgi:hypothetical protein